MKPCRSVADRLEHLITCNAEYQTACREVVTACGGLVSRWEVYGVVVVVHEKLRTILHRYGLQVDAPKPNAVQKLFEAHARNNQLNCTEFEQFLAELLLQIAVSGAVASSRKYGIGMVAGVSCLSLLKIVANFHLAFAPTVILGPMAGVAAVYVIQTKQSKFKTMLSGNPDPMPDT